MNSWIVWISFIEILVGIFGITAGAFIMLEEIGNKLGIISVFIFSFMSAIPITLGFKSILEESKK